MTTTPAPKGADIEGLVNGIGIYDPAVLHKRQSPQVAKTYSIWNNMLRRMTPQHCRRFPTYIGASVSHEFLHFAMFSEWAMRQVGWDSEGFQLDKDFLTKGNLVYSPSTCVFLPAAINYLLTRRKACRGELPIGVKSFRPGQFVACLRIDGKNTHIGSFRTPDEAFLAYKTAKEANIRRMADQYRDRLDPRAYAAMLAYQVEITD